MPSDDATSELMRCLPQPQGGTVIPTTWAENGRQAGRATRDLAGDDRTFVTSIKAVHGPINLAVLGHLDGRIGAKPLSR